ncbi:hypothetical protein MBLNU459_g2368t1 [Dothideomycetes sp. NU459]
MGLEAKGATEEVRPIDESLSDNGNHFSSPFWAPGFVARFPWLGFGALFTVLLCTVGSVLTLVLSNNRSQTHWPKQIAPNVIIGGLNNLANIMFGIAIGNGIAIAWWRQTLKGSTIEDLHRSWTFSSSFKDLALSGKYFNWIALAALTTKLTILDSILLQRATSTEIWSDNAVNVTNIEGFLNTTIPITGLVTGRSAAPGLLTNNSIIDAQLWQQSSAPMENNFNYCDGQCVLDVPGSGFEISCEDATQDIDYGSSSQAAVSAIGHWTSNNETGPEPNVTLSYNMFSINFEASYRTNVDGADYPDGVDYSTISMTIIYTQANDTPASDGSQVCPGKLVQRTCTLRPAVVTYPSTMTNYSGTSEDGLANGIMLTPYSNNDMAASTSATNQAASLVNYNETTKQQDGVKIMGYNNVYEDHSFNLDGSPSQLGGIVELLSNYLGANASIQWEGTAGFVISQQGLALSSLIGWPSAGSQYCGYTYGDPINYVVQQINQLMFIYSLDPWEADPANDFNATRRLPAQMYRARIHYVSDLRYMYGAIASTLFCVLCVLPSYYGYWQLGRKVTLGPFEIANAFRSPVLESEASNGGVDDLIKVVGERRVKYGEMVTEQQAGRLAVAEPESVRRVHPSIGSARVEINERLGQVLSKGWT